MNSTGTSHRFVEVTKSTLALVESPVVLPPL